MSGWRAGPLPGDYELVGEDTTARGSLQLRHRGNDLRPMPGIYGRLGVYAGRAPSGERAPILRPGHRWSNLLALWLAIHAEPRWMKWYVFVQLAHVAWNR